jgi:hypothetical protein
LFLLPNNLTILSCLFARDASLNHQSIDVIELADDCLSLHNLKLLQSMLNQLLYPARVVDCLVLVKCIPRASLGVLAEVVRSELASLP